jgi:hypothetical protein
VKKRQQILQYKGKIPSNNAQTWTMGEKPKQTLPEHSKGTRKASRESQKSQQWLLGYFVGKAGSTSVMCLGLSSTLRVRLFDGDADGNATFG